MRWLGFEAHIWGNPDPANVDPIYDFNTTVELEREFIGALVRNCGGETGFRLSGARWIQPQHWVRRGRLLVLSFALKTPVVDDASVLLPWATATSSGVEGIITIVAQSPSESTAVATFIAPPPES